MFLEQLRDFEWYNEPADVSFDERGMRGFEPGQNRFLAESAPQVFQRRRPFLFHAQNRQFFLHRQMEF